MSGVSNAITMNPRHSAGVSRRRKKLLLYASSVLLMLLAISCFTVPLMMQWYSERQLSLQAVEYANKAAAADNAKELKQAEQYNQWLAAGNQQIGKLDSKYAKQLDSQTVMATINIPSINVNLPIYHGAEGSDAQDEVLAKGVMHEPGTSLPVGGKGTHALLSAHRGVPNAKLFTDLDAMKKGDVFTITVDGRLLTYKVDTIKTVLPAELTTMFINPNEDRVSLFTCTPYGMNTHRLIVSGIRVPNDTKSENTGFRWSTGLTILTITIITLMAFITTIIVVLNHKRHPRHKRP